MREGVEKCMNCHGPRSSVPEQDGPVTGSCMWADARFHGDTVWIETTFLALCGKCCAVVVQALQGRKN